MEKYGAMTRKRKTFCHKIASFFAADKRGGRNNEAKICPIDFLRYGEVVGGIRGWVVTGVKKWLVGE